MAFLTVATGIYYRFLGFSQWSLATDEYYVYRSVTFILSTGLPEFPCGGYYTRGLLYQYIVAPLLLVGMSPASALRVVTILSNLALFPAIWLLARKLGGPRVAAAAIIILSLSVWQIEMARFGRMYAPFQAIFLWYVYHLYRLMTEADHRRWPYLICLSIVGPLVWEGGVILALLNFIPLLAHQKYRTWSSVVVSIMVIAAVLAFLSINFRTLGAATALPPESAGGAVSTKSLIGSIPILLPDALAEPWSAAVVFGLIALVLFAMTRIAPRRVGTQAILGLGLIFVTLLFNQLLLAIMVFFGAVLIGWLPRSVARQRSLTLLWFSFLVLAAWWVFYSVAVLGNNLRLTQQLEPLVKFPDLYASLIFPWANVDLLLSVLLALGIGLAGLFGVIRPKEPMAGVSALLLTLLFSFVLIGGSASLYHETRYAFFLYPLFVILALFGIASSARNLMPRTSWPTSMALIAFLAAFGATNDLSFDHLRNINSYDTNFRVAMPDAEARHYYTRHDYASASAFVDSNKSPDDQIITTSVPATLYLESVGYVYLDRSDHRHRGQACNFGRAERWSNWPLLSSIDEVDVTIDADNGGHYTWVIADHLSLRDDEWTAYLNDRDRFDNEYVSPDGRLRVFRTRHHGDD
ncbi:glycosyltransferase family 39 protein [Wenzhouxiangella sp. XN24]|uniref:ArnT family glycosyltransferase n=1 Tax=Wenzhouxiangella sp. XN24 TaxID=2713569 RepID=UPI0013EB0F1C|nr:glycosyltransferase family 39 protein [Wenzhouxiangella sp. XN24]NGX16869.1 glycosyltransferase family 39 protein [Wenzhouxiangella sp. XN24]